MTPPTPKLGPQSPDIDLVTPPDASNSQQRDPVGASFGDVLSRGSFGNSDSQRGSVPVAGSGWIDVRAERRKQRAPRPVPSRQRLRRRAAEEEEEEEEDADSFAVADDDADDDGEDVVIARRLKRYKDADHSCRHCGLSFERMDELGTHLQRDHPAAPVVSSSAAVGGRRVRLAKRLVRKIVPEATDDVLILDGDCVPERDGLHQEEEEEEEGADAVGDSGVDEDDADGDAKLHALDAGLADEVVLAGDSPATKTPRKLRGPQTLDELVRVCAAFGAELKTRLATANAAEGSNAIVEQPKSLNAALSLKPHQIAGLNWLFLMHRAGRSGILADEMGLGKTIQVQCWCRCCSSLLTLHGKVIAFLAHLREWAFDDPPSAIIVVPASVVSNWMAELERWAPSLTVCLYYGDQAERRNIQHQWDDLDEQPAVFVTTYDIVIKDEDRRWLSRRSCEYVRHCSLRFTLFASLLCLQLIVDEGHEARTAATLRHKALVRLKCPRRLLLTGTPLHNNHREMLNLLYLLNPQLFVDHESFENVLSDGRKAELDKVVPALRAVIAPFMLRRLKSEVLTLPPKNKVARARAYGASD